jgi:hypothetical protein
MKGTMRAGFAFLVPLPSRSAACAAVSCSRSGYLALAIKLAARAKDVAALQAANIAIAETWVVRLPGREHF